MKSGEVRKPPWHAKALRLESKIRKEQTGVLSQAVAEREIIKQWPEDKGELSKLPSLKNFPKSLELFLRDDKKPKGEQPQ